uniref:Secreted protein n=1 Tax=Syphacia muris TaxID=451379 RepID=A0A158R4I9_9BILA
MRLLLTLLLVSSFCVLISAIPLLDGLKEDSGYVDKRSLASGRWGLRPGKRSLGPLTPSDMFGGNGDGQFLLLPDAYDRPQHLYWWLG